MGLLSAPLMGFCLFKRWVGYIRSLVELLTHASHISISTEFCFSLAKLHTGHSLKTPKHCLTPTAIVSRTWNWKSEKLYNEFGLSCQLNISCLFAIVSVMLCLYSCSSVTSPSGLLLLLLEIPSDDKEEVYSQYLMDSPCQDFNRCRFSSHEVSF